MASFCSNGAISAAGLQQGNVQVSIQSPSLSLHNRFGLVTKAIRFGCLRDGLLINDYLPSNDSYCRRSSGGRRFTTTCVVTTPVVEQGTELSGKPAPSETGAPNSKPTTPALNSKPVVKAQPSEVLKPAPRPVPKPQLQPNATSLPANANASNRAVWSNDAKKGGNEYRHVFRSSDKTVKINGRAAGSTPIDNLDQILEKAERMIDQSANPPQRDSRYMKSTWRKGVGVDRPPSKPALSQGDKTAEKETLSGVTNNASMEAFADSVLNSSVGASTTLRAEKLELNKPGFMKSTWRKGVGMDGPLRKLAPQQGDKTIERENGSPSGVVDDASLVARATSMTAAPVIASQSSVTTGKLELNKPALNKPSLRPLPIKRPNPAILQGVKAEPETAELKDISKEKPLKDLQKGTDMPAGPLKSGRVSALKGKDNKEDWRKKLTTDGPKRRVVTKALSEDDGGDAGLAEGFGSTRRLGRKMSKASRKAARLEAERAATPVKVDILEVGKQGMSVPDLAQKLAVNDAEIIKTLFLKGIATTVNQTLDGDTVKLVCQEFDVEVIEADMVKLEDMAKKTGKILYAKEGDNLEARAPVVTIMGHVDHGKTSLLDYIRKSKVAASEAGGITQGIGAYRVNVKVDGEEQSCVFLDTPGHQAFSAMRARGARVTDIAIIVVAADDGVRPQTQEAIAHAKAANVPIIVAINKIDKDTAEPERVMQELVGIGLLPEDWGGDVPMVQVSALTGQNVDSLLETIMLVAEFQELKANPKRSAKGTVIESCLDKTKGVMASLLVQNGTLNKGDVVLCGEAYGRVRALLDDTGARADKAGPSTAVQVLGLSTVPVAGDEFEVVDSLDIARNIAEERTEGARAARLATQAAEGKVTLALLATSIAESWGNSVERHQLNVVLKVDLQGTLEAIREALGTLPQDTVNLRLLMQATGDITYSDVDLAIASKAIIIGFNVGVQPGVQSHANSAGVEVRLYKIIYELVDDIRNAMEGLLKVVEEEVPIGNAELRAIFSSGSGKVAGCMVREGKIVKGCCCKVVRDGKIIHTGSVTSLRRVKENAKEVVLGLECGVGVMGFNEWQEGDIIETFNLVAKKRTLEEAAVAMASSLTAMTANASAISTTQQPPAVTAARASV